MTEVEIKFQQEHQEGVVPVGTYLIDAAKRFGIRLEDTCLVDEGIHYCSVTVPSGSHLLSPETKAESEHFAASGRAAWQAMATCFVDTSVNATIHAETAPYGVGYFAASWVRAQ